MAWILLALVTAVLALPLVLELRRFLPDGDQAPGRMLRLSQGRTHALWQGPSRGGVVVMVHGLTTPSPVFAGMARGLADAGYRVLSYDLYGRGFSDTVPGRQDEAFFLRQLGDLLDHERLTEDVILVGYSMGGGIAAAFAAAQPDRIKHVFLLAPAGIAYDVSPWERALRLPLIGDWLNVAVEPWLMRRQIRGQGETEVPGIEAVQLAETGRQGFFASVLSSRRRFLAQAQEAAHRALGRDDIPVTAIWGGADEVIPIRGVGILTEWNRLAVQEVVEEAGHGLPHTHASRVVGIMRERLREG